MMPPIVGSLQPRLLAALLLAGCATAGPHEDLLKDGVDRASPRFDEANRLWNALPEEERCEALRAGLRSSDPAVALAAARAASPTMHSLDEIHRQAGILVARAQEYLDWAGAPDGVSWCIGLQSLGSPEVMDLYRAAVERDPEGNLPRPPDELHRVTNQDHLPGLAALLPPANGEVFRAVDWNFRLLADNSDRHHDEVERALLFIRAAMLAEAEGRPAPSPEDFSASPPGPGIPENFRLLVQAAWEIGDEPLQGAFHVPPCWLTRWISSLRPGERDLPFLADVAGRIPQDGLHEGYRAWAVGAIAKVGDPEAGRVLAALRADGGPVDAWIAQGAQEPAPEAWSAVEAHRRAIEARGWLEGTGLATWELRGFLLLVEAAAPDAADDLLRHWARTAPDPDTRGQVLWWRFRRGDATLASEDLQAITFPSDAWSLVRTRDHRVREQAEALRRDPQAGQAGALAALAAWNGLPDPLAEVVADHLDMGGEAFPLLAERPAEAVLDLAGRGRLGATGIARLGLLGERARPVLELYRRERHRGMYWPATAGLAIAGDPAARAEFLALLREDRTAIWDAWFDPLACSLNGDPEALAYWRSRVGSNCCLWGRAERVLARWYPTMPAGMRDGDPDGMEERCRLWWERWGGRLRWSRLADGWVPAAE